MKPTILVLEDEPDIRFLIENSLSGEGFKVVGVSTADGFWAATRMHIIDMFIIDLMLPDANGLNIIREIRKTSDVGIIILSGKSDETDRILGLELGADDYVTKPFRIRELQARVNSVHRRTKGAQFLAVSPSTAPKTAGNGIPMPAVDYAFDGYEVSLLSRNVTGPTGANIVLTTAEFELLTAFLKRRNQVLSRDQIMNAVKGREWESYDRAVDGLVSRLRKKIPSPDEASPYIRTVHGIGYIFVK